MLFRKLQSYDIFISYVVEDRELVEEFSERLTNAGYRVWYAKQELFAGADVISEVKNGLRNSRYGIAIISQNYKGHWAKGELFVLLDKKERFFPIFHNVTPEEVSQDHPAVLMQWGQSTREGINSVIDNITCQIKIQPKVYYWAAGVVAWLRKRLYIIVIAVILLLALSLSLTLFIIYESKRPSSTEIDAFIHQRKQSIENTVVASVQKNLISAKSKATTLEYINQLYNNAISSQAKPSYRNKFIFYNGIDRFQTLIGLKSLGIIPSTGPLEAPFGLNHYQVYLFDHKDSGELFLLKYGLVNTAPLGHTISNERLGPNDLFEADIQFTNPIRLIEIDIVYDELQGKQNRTVYLFGAKPQETIVCEKRGNMWGVLQIQ